MRVGEGFIEEIKENGLAKVRVSRDSLYVACSACAAADHVKIVAYNYLGADEGDRVRYQVDDSHLISGAFVCFIVPVFLILAAAVLGYFVNSNEIGALIGAAIGAAMTTCWDVSLIRRLRLSALSETMRMKNRNCIMFYLRKNQGTGLYQSPGFVL